jgi:glucose-1-phosphate thymidylyltransferase
MAPILRMVDPILTHGIIPYMKGIILAGGSGKRLWPATRGASKQLFPIYDKPLIHYPLATLMLAGIREILVITTSEDQSSFIRLLGDGHDIGLDISFKIQPKPEGLAQAFTIGADFIGADSVALILGDNIFQGTGLGGELGKYSQPAGALVFGYTVTDPHRYGVAEIDEDGGVVSITEKPTHPKSNIAIPGLYFFDNSVVAKATNVKVGKRGELEITSILEMYRIENRLKLQLLPRGTAWLDCGTANSLNDACNFIRVIEERQGLKVGCIEEIAWRNNWIDTDELVSLAASYGNSSYSEYLLKIVQ